MTNKRTKWSRWYLAIGTAALLGPALFLYYVGSKLIAPARHAVGAPPADLGAFTVNISGGVHGWFVPGVQGAPCVALMHGVRADRSSMVSRARFLREAGYSSLLFDFQAHGESPGENITFGARESVDARAAVTLLRDKFRCSRVAAIGQSLGGAAALLGTEPLDVDALVLESVYPTIEEAIADRLRIRLGEEGGSLAPLLTLQLKPRLNVDALELRPIDHISRSASPVLVIAGSEDRHTTILESRRLFDAAKNPKEFWEVGGAAHVDIYSFTLGPYRQRILGFFAKYLGDRKAQNPL